MFDFVFTGPLDTSVFSNYHHARLARGIVRSAAVAAAGPVASTDDQLLPRETTTGALEMTSTHPKRGLPLAPCYPSSPTASRTDDASPTMSRR